MVSSRAGAIGNDAVDNSCQNIAFQIVEQGAVKDESSLRADSRNVRDHAASCDLFEQERNALAPLYWDRYVNKSR
jgi:hypothetical protein